MTFPSLVGASLVSDASNTTNHLWTYPVVTGGIKKNDLLLGFLCLDSGTAPVLGNLPSGWVNVIKDNWHISASAQYAYKWADGGETGNFTTTSSNSNQANTVILCIRGADTSINPEHTQAETASGSTIDPPNNTPTGGGKDYFWAAFEGHDGGDALTATPSNMTGDNGTIGNGSGGTRVSYDTHSENVASFNPNAWTITGSEASYSLTIAVHPKPPPPPPFRLFGTADREFPASNGIREFPRA